LTFPARILRLNANPAAVSIASASLRSALTDILPVAVI
jgi:hypothetical protein